MQFRRNESLFKQLSQISVLQTAIEEVLEGVDGHCVCGRNSDAIQTVVISLLQDQLDVGMRGTELEEKFERIGWEFD